MPVHESVRASPYQHAQRKEHYNNWETWHRTMYAGVAENLAKPLMTYSQAAGTVSGCCSPFTATTGAPQATASCLAQKSDFSDWKLSSR